MFALFSVCTAYLGIDLGSQYIKVAESTISGVPRILKDSNNKVSIPSAAALKHPIDLLNVPSNLSDFYIKFGAAALPVLKKNPELGHEFLPRVIGRNGSSLDTSKYLTATELFSLYILDFLFKYKNEAKIAVAIPSYWTPNQKRALSDSFDIFRIPIIGIMEDSIAISSLYSATKTHRYTNKSRNVIFVDIGATSVKVSAQTFIWYGNYSIVNETANEWSEQVGGYFMAKKIAEKKGISIKKATKLLYQSNSDSLVQYLGEEMYEITRVIQTACLKMLDKVQSLPNNTNEIDEVQLIGGASLIRFIPDLVKNATKFEKVSRDFNANEAIALGSVIAAEFKDGISKYPPSRLLPIPPYTMSVTCNITHAYCYKGTQCRSTIVEEGTNGCSVLKFVADPKEVPEGVDYVFTQYKLTNISNYTFTSESKGYFEMLIPYTKLNRVVWCTNGNCSLINSELMGHYHGSFKAIDFLDKYTKEDNNRRQKERLSAQLAEVSGTIEKVFIQFLPDELQPRIHAIQNAILNGETASWGVNDLIRGMDDLKLAIKTLLKLREEHGKQENNKEL